MALHEVQLKGYSVRPGNLSLGTFDSYGIEQLHVTLDDTWSGLAVTATFNPPEGEPVEIRVPENGLVDVPAEATANEGTGTIVYCGVANGVQRISKTQGYNVITHANAGGTALFNPSESLATQVLQAALKAEKNSAEAKSAAASAVTAAANSASAAKTSEDAAANSAADADRTANSINASMAQIAANKEAIGKLKDGKISKFYASSQGDTNLPDSDDGRIMDLKLYGKSNQDGTPTPDAPVEIKSVVNPVVKVMGKNLLSELNLSTRTKLGITVSSAGQGKIAVKGTATGEASFDYWGQNFWIPKGAKLLCKILQGSGQNKNGITFFSDNFTGGLTTNFGGVSSISARSGYPCKMVRVHIPSGESVDCTLGLSLQMDASTDYEPYTEQTATLTYTLNAIPVTSGGNVTIDGQQYVADYVDVERGKLVRMVDSSKLDTSQSIIDKTDWLLATPTETDLTADEIAAFKALVSYYPVTNVSTTSDQLDGYTVFNYPISLANGWNYVKQQLGDTRDYLYGIDLMTAEAYVNSEYAAALAEIEV